MLLTVQSILTAGCLVASTAAAQLSPGHKALQSFKLAVSVQATVFADPTCKAIQAVISNASSIYAPGQQQYAQDIKHYCSSGDVFSRCSVEPGNINDLAAIIKVLGKSNSTFAVKGAGHSCAPGFSGAKGVTVAMTRFNEVSYDKARGLVKYGSGLIWDDVYKGLEKYDVKVTGGRVSGVGVAGFSLGGGYSFLTNQYGLTSDGIVAYDFVTATGKIMHVTRAKNPDLFFLLQGGFNNAGVVTNFYAKARPRAKIWGGIAFIDANSIDKVLNLTAQFASEQNTDLRASILPTINSFAGIPVIEVQLFYDDPNGPAKGSFVANIFDAFLALPGLSKDVAGNRTMSAFVKLAPSGAVAGMRGTFSSVSLERLTPEILQTIKQEFQFYGATALLGGGTFVSYDLEPFAKAASYPAADTTAWPHDKQVSPLNIYFAWPLGLSDSIFLNAVAKTTQKIRDAAIAQGQKLDGLYTYTNYALYNSPFEQVYGPNVQRLTSIAAKYDPEKVMTRAGGFQFQRGPNTYNFSFPP